VEPDGILDDRELVAIPTKCFMPQISDWSEVKRPAEAPEYIKLWRVRKLPSIVFSCDLIGCGYGRGLKSSLLFFDQQPSFLSMQLGLSLP